jgi:hypothetical protein
VFGVVFFYYKHLHLLMWVKKEGKKKHVYAKERIVRHTNKNTYNIMRPIKIGSSDLVVVNPWWEMCVDIHWICISSIDRLHRWYAYEGALREALCLS